MTELGCLAHARRKFFDLNEAQANPIAQEALARIAALYVIEAQDRDMDVDARSQLRQEYAQPLLQSMHDWMLKTRVNVANGGGTAKAIDYSLKRWVALSRYATAGNFPIDTIRWRTPSAPSLSGRRTGSSPVPSAPANGLRRFRVCWPPPNSMVWILRHGYAQRSRLCRLASTARSIRCYPFVWNLYTRPLRKRRWAR